MKLKRKFFNRNTIVVARELLGKYLVRRVNGKIIKARITETEAYCGIKDKACHASKGMTERTKIMFGPPGHAYIYLVYGMYHCLNVVTREAGCPEAVLIRKAEVKVGNVRNVGGEQFEQVKRLNKQSSPTSEAIKQLSGPGILCRELKIDKSLNGVDLCKSKELLIESLGEKPKRTKRGKRIGVDYAGKWRDKLWRFYVDLEA